MGALETEEIVVLIRNEGNGVFMLPPPKLIKPCLRAWKPESYKSPGIRVLRISASQGQPWATDVEAGSWECKHSGDWNAQKVKASKRRRGEDANISRVSLHLHLHPHQKQNNGNMLSSFPPKYYHYYTLSKGIQAPVDVWQTIQGEQKRYSLQTHGPEVRLGWLKSCGRVEKNEFQEVGIFKIF